MSRQTLHTLSFIFSCALIAVASHGYATPVTYQFNDYPTEQGSGTQSGSITVDDALGSISGELESGEITAWQVIVTGHSTFPDISFGTTSQEGDALEITITGTIGVSATELTLPQPTSPNTFNYLEFRDVDSGTGLPFGLLDWNRERGSSTRSESYRLFDTNGTITPGDDLEYWNYQTSGSFGPLGGTDPWVIASVPEPSSIALAAFGLLGIACGRRKQA